MVVGVITLTIIAIATIVIYNKFIKYKNLIEEQMSQIDIQLKRRFDLIPNLIEVVKNYNAYEEKTLKEIIALRNSFESDNNHEQTMTTDNTLEQYLTKIYAVSEGYPELKSNKNYLMLQKNLTDTENRISISRAFYNEVVLKYNTLVKTFPCNLLAKIFKFKEIEYYKVEENKKEMPLNS